jgi:hypothetical protein
VSVPLCLVRDLSWDACQYVTVEIGPENTLIVRRLPGDDGKSNDSAVSADGVD